MGNLTRSPICIHNTHSLQHVSHPLPPHPHCSWWIKLVDGLREQWYHQMFDHDECMGL